MAVHRLRVRKRLLAGNIKESKPIKGTHWTLLGYEVERDLVAPRAGLHIHTFGARGDVIDEGDHSRDAYALKSGDWVLARPDGYVGAIVATEQIKSLENYVPMVGQG
ncbi:hypothetical protein [Paraburkholderia sp. D1E]|uniref:hypothetical protein n=1 Tax=Paraburkholderia sp. D1E TaxID=3461398 RepID=UPI004045B7FC